MAFSAKIWPCPHRFWSQTCGYHSVLDMREVFISSMLLAGSKPLVSVFELRALLLVSCWTLHRFLMSLIFLMPLNTSLYWLVLFLISGLRSLSCLTLLMPSGSSWCLRSLVLAKEPSSLICNIPSSWRVLLLMRGGELIVRLVTTNLPTASQVWFLKVAVNSPFTGSSLCKVLNFIQLGCSVSFTLDWFVSALTWCSSMTFTSALLSGSALTSTSSIFTDTVLSSPSALIFYTCFRCLMAWQKNSSLELAKLSASSSSVVLFMWCLCLGFSGGLWLYFCPLPFLLLCGPLDLHTELKWELLTFHTFLPICWTVLAFLMCVCLSAVSPGLLSPTALFVLG